MLFVHLFVTTTLMQITYVHFEQFPRSLLAPFSTAGDDLGG